MLISVSGLIGSGKNSVANYLVQNHGFVQESFAKAVKDAVSVIFGWDREMLEGVTAAARAQRDVVDTWWASRLSIPHLTPRWVLQQFGTNVCREHFHQDIWLASLEKRLLSLEGKNVVISDARFFNELGVVNKLKGTTVVVKRGDQPDWWQTAQKVYTDDHSMELMKLSPVHQSEWDWAGYSFNTLIDNNDTLDHLFYQVDSLLLDIKSRV